MLNLMNANCDPAGFPNGRRPGDDVVDIELSVVTGFLLPGDSNPNRNADRSRKVYHDEALVSSADFDAAFPYLKAPRPGSMNGTGANQNGIPNPAPAAP